MAESLQYGNTEPALFVSHMRHLEGRLFSSSDDQF
jgi:hypothetical protein